MLPCFNVKDSIICLAFRKTLSKIQIFESSFELSKICLKMKVFFAGFLRSVVVLTNAEPDHNPAYKLLHLPKNFFVSIIFKKLFPIHF